MSVCPVSREEVERLGTNEEEEKRIREYLKKVDKNYYRPDIKERKTISGEVIDTERDPGRTLPEIHPSE